MATTWDKLYPYVQPYVPGCPEVVIKTHLQEAAAEYCANSEVWRYNLEPSFTSKNTSDYELDVPNRAVLENIMVLMLDGVPMTHVSERHSFPRTDSDGSAVTGTPTQYSVFQDASIRMYPTPLSKHTFTGVLVVKPSLSAKGIEDFIFESHGRSIAAGAIARIAGIPNKEWSDPDVSMRSQIEFERAMCAAKGRDTRRVNMRVASVNF
jgi:hypothetical protein